MKVLVFLCSLICSLALNSSPNSFAQAKKIAEAIFARHPQTIYRAWGAMEQPTDLSPLY